MDYNRPHRQILATYARQLSDTSSKLLNKRPLYHRSVSAGQTRGPDGVARQTHQKKDKIRRPERSKSAFVASSAAKNIQEHQNVFPGEYEPNDSSHHVDLLTLSKFAAAKNEARKPRRIQSANPRLRFGLGVEPDILQHNGKNRPFSAVAACTRNPVLETSSHSKTTDSPSTLEPCVFGYKSGIYISGGHSQRPVVAPKSNSWLWEDSFVNKSQSNTDMKEEDEVSLSDLIDFDEDEEKEQSR